MSRFSLLIITLSFICFHQFTWCAKSSKKELPKYPKLSDKVKKAEKIDGFFTLYRQDNQVYMEVPKAMLKKEFFMYTSLSKGTFGGMMLPHWTLSQQTLYFEKIGKSIVLFEKDPVNVQKVYQRKKMWRYIEEIKKDKYLRQFLILD